MGDGNFAIGFDEKDIDLRGSWSEMRLKARCLERR